jgi:hypothetical protein
MKSLLLITLFTFIRLFAFCQSEEEAVKEVVTTAYIKGIHNSGPIDDIRKGFHPSFNMLRFMNNEVSPYSIDEWVKNIEKNRSENPNPALTPTVGKFVQVIVSGNAANVVLELFRADKKIFTDHLLLYQFQEGWRIVSKTYFRHP